VARLGDIDAEGLGVCAGTSFDAQAANRIGLRVAYVAEIERRVEPDDPRGVRAEGCLRSSWSSRSDRCPRCQWPEPRRRPGIVSHWGGGQAVDDRIDERALALLARRRATSTRRSTTRRARSGGAGAAEWVR
jgi:hypothetical protein